MAASTMAMGRIMVPEPESPTTTPKEEEEEHETVLTSPLSLSSLSPDNPVYLQLPSPPSPPSSSDGEDSPPTMDDGGSPVVVENQRRRVLRSTTSSLSKEEEEDSENESLKHHFRQPSTVSDLPPPGFFDSASNQSLESLQRRSQSELLLHPSSYVATKLLVQLSSLLDKHEAIGATWIGFWALLMVTCANYMLTPMRDAVALAVGVKHMPALTLASTALAIVSSVPIGWLFEAPDPKRRKLWKAMGLTRGETQGTSLALFYRFFAVTLLSYAVGFELNSGNDNGGESDATTPSGATDTLSSILTKLTDLLWYSSLSKFMYVAFFLVVHLMKLHSLSLVWGVTTEAMEYEEHAKKRKGLLQKGGKTRLQRLAFVGFGGTLGGILGSIIASTTAHALRMSGLLVVAAGLLEVSAQLSIELGRIMQIHWEEEKHYKSTDDLTSLLLDTSMKRSQSMESMKRVASGNSLSKMNRSKSLQRMDAHNNNNCAASSSSEGSMTIEEQMNDNSFSQRLLRGITTILRSRLLMAIFTYNALYASTSVLLSFQRAELVVNRHSEGSNSSTTDDTAFLAKINMASSVAVFLLQASGMGAWIAHTCGSRGTLALIPCFRMMGVFLLAWWHFTSNGQPPNLLCFLLLDECTKVINFAVAKPVRESLWRGLSNEARYEAKPIVDTLANRWGGGSAAFLVSLLDKAVKYTAGEQRKSILGFSPNMLLCIIVAVWWAVVSADLGHIRKRIDMELLKKNQ